MLSRRKTISRLLDSQDDRASYLRAKLSQLIPSQIKALRGKERWSQAQLGEMSAMKQSRISASERPGGANFALETLIRLAASFKVGLQVRFVSYSEMIDWENGFSQDTFSVLKIEDDEDFIHGRTLPQANIFQIGKCMSAEGEQQRVKEGYNSMSQGMISGRNDAASGGQQWQM